MSTEAELTEPQAVFARRTGKKPQWISELRRRGLPMTNDGRHVRVVAALEWMRQNVPPAHGSSEGGQGGESLMEAKTRLTLAQAEKAEHDLRVAKGSVIDREEARRGAATFGRAFRDEVLNFAARSGPELAHELGVSPRALIAALDRALRQMLVDLGKKPMPPTIARDGDGPVMPLDGV